MTNREMMEIAMRQSAEDMGCRVEDLKADKNVVVPINLGKKARKYLKEPITCNLVSYGNNIMAASIPETMDLVSAYVDKFEFYHCFETPDMHCTKYVSWQNTICRTSAGYRLFPAPM